MAEDTLLVEWPQSTSADHILGHKSKFNTCKAIGMQCSVSSDHNKNKLEICKRKTLKNTPKTTPFTTSM